MLLASRFALIVIESREEARVLAVVREASLKARRGRGWGVFQWTVTEGLQRIDVDMGGPQDGRPTMHARHGGPLPFDLDHVAEHLGDVGLVVVETGPIESGMRRLERLRYLLATPAMSPGAR